jgi:CBS domain-containing protein
MQVHEIMTPRIEKIHPDGTLQEAAEMMKELGVGILPIGEDNRIVGMLTDRDITVRAVSEGYDPFTNKVREIMTPEVICCYEDQDVDEAASLMFNMQVRRLIVLNREEHHVGIISLGDLMLSLSRSGLSH